VRVFQLQRSADLASAVRRDAVADADLQPATMQDYPRIGMFPEVAATVRDTIRAGLHRNAFMAVTNYERLHLDACLTPLLVQIEAVAIRDSRWYYQPPPRSQSATGAPGAWKRWLRLSTYIHWGFFQQAAHVVGAERWTVDRCGGAQRSSYRVHYFRSADGDVFFARVLPTSWAGAVDFVRLKLKGTL